MPLSFTAHLWLGTGGVQKVWLWTEALRYRGLQGCETGTPVDMQGQLHHTTMQPLGPFVSLAQCMCCLHAGC